MSLLYIKQNGAKKGDSSLAECVFNSSFHSSGQETLTYCSFSTVYAGKNGLFVYYLLTSGSLVLWNAATFTKSEKVRDPGDTTRCFTSFLYNTVPFFSISPLLGKQEVTDKRKKNFFLQKRSKKSLKTGKVLQ